MLHGRRERGVKNAHKNNIFRSNHVVSMKGRPILLILYGKVIPTIPWLSNCIMHIVCSLPCVLSFSRFIGLIILVRFSLNFKGQLTVQYFIILIYLLYFFISLKVKTNKIIRC